MRHLEDWQRQAMLGRLEDLRRQVHKHEFAYAWGIVSVWGEEYPLDSVVCDWLDERPHPTGWSIIRRPLNRR